MPSAKLSRSVTARSSAWIVFGITFLFAGMGRSGEPLNIVFILCDDTAFNEFHFNRDGFHANPDFPTPRLDRLAREGVQFSQAYVTSPVCGPSRAGILSGRYPQEIGFETNIRNVSDGFPAEHPMLSEILRDLGYITGAIGKWHIGSVPGFRPSDRGFAEFFGFLGGSRSYYGVSSDLTQRIRRTHIGQGLFEVSWKSWINEGDPDLYDPARGRYLTDAFGEEAASFIRRHAAGPAPFFLYVPVNAVHNPFEDKAGDRLAVLQQSVGSTPPPSPLSAMTYALDRVVGSVLDALEDPDGDRRTDDGILDDTLLVFMNDNGPIPEPAGRDNSPLRGYKYDMFEGGIRVPLIIRDPRLGTEGRDVTFPRVVSAMDLFPTFLAAAGGVPSGGPSTDGVDLFPVLEETFVAGGEPPEPHPLLFWRWGPEGWAVRKGDWKLVRSGENAPLELFDLATDVGESTDVRATRPEKLEELLDELDLWEAKQARPRWGWSGDPFLSWSVNDFDGFLFRAGNTPWSAGGRWRDSAANDDINHSLHPADCSANMRLAFPIRDNGSYTTTNDLTRLSGMCVILNQIAFVGDFTNFEDRSATIDGNPLLLVASREGSPPTIRLDATGNSTEARFSFRLDVDLRISQDLEITGDGTQPFTLDGDIGDYCDSSAESAECAGLLKTGSSAVVLRGDNSYGGPTIVQGGTLVVDGSHGDGEEYTVEPGGTLSGGGAICADIVVHGTLAPGRPAVPGHLRIGGLEQSETGTLRIELSGERMGTDYDAVTVAGEVLLAGGLEVSLINGYIPPELTEYTILEASAITGEFSEVTLPPGTALTVRGGKVLVTTGVCETATGFACVASGDSVELTWVPAPGHVAVHLRRDAEDLATVPGDVTSFVDRGQGAVAHSYEIVGECAGGGLSGAAACEYEPPTCEPFSSFACHATGPDIALTWKAGDTYERIRVYRDRELIAEVPGTTTEFTDSGLSSGQYLYEIEGDCGALVTPREECSVDHSVAPTFIRGDADGDGILNGLLDGLFTLDFQFQNGPPLPCPEAGDADGDGILNGLLDTLVVFAHQFQSGPAPPSPYPRCGVDPDPESSLGCAATGCP